MASRDRLHKPPDGAWGARMRRILTPPILTTPAVLYSAASTSANTFYHTCHFSFHTYISPPYGGTHSLINRLTTFRFPQMEISFSRLLQQSSTWEWVFVVDTSWILDMFLRSIRLRAQPASTGHLHTYKSWFAWHAQWVPLVLRRHEQSLASFINLLSCCWRKRTTVSFLTTGTFLSVSVKFEFQSAPLRH
jgi:hypothetical protein